MVKNETVIAVIGNARSGKSTLIENFVNSAGGAYNDEELAPLECETAKYRVTFYDIPDVDSLRENIENGNINPNAAILCVSGWTGEGIHENDDQTPEYIAVAHELGIPEVAVAITKMDTTQWSEERLREQKMEASNVARPGHGQPTLYDSRAIAFVPVSGKYGDNLFEESRNMPWHVGWRRSLDRGVIMGKTLIDAIDSFGSVRRG